MVRSAMARASTCSVGVVRDALCDYAVKSDVRDPTLLPVVAETDDTWLSESETFPITRDLVFAGLESATGGRLAEGNLGGGARGAPPRCKRRNGTASGGGRPGQGPLRC